MPLGYAWPARAQPVGSALFKFSPRVNAALALAHHLLPVSASLPAIICIWRRRYLCWCVAINIFFEFLFTRPNKAPFLVATGFSARGRSRNAHFLLGIFFDGDKVASVTKLCPIPYWILTHKCKFSCLIHGRLVIRAMHVLMQNL